MTAGFIMMSSFPKRASSEMRCVKSALKSTADGGQTKLKEEEPVEVVASTEIKLEEEGTSPLLMCGSRRSILLMGSKDHL
eukprot:scaffold42770_cov205-Skeletonema_dohrnii-CCMP3373.AAC.2